MSKFNKKKNAEVPAVNTASLPDIVFMLLFFFMVATVMRDDELQIENQLPKANQVEKLAEKKKVVTIYIGKPSPNFTKQYGVTEVIQLGDKISPLSDVQTYVNTKRNAMDEDDKDEMMVSLKVDQNSQVGILTDVKQELRDALALKISYTSIEGDPLRNLKN
ncbi:biopolymer transport protein ExbD [Nonlabens dokdonensis]|jgi:biopolymer transport protein ExbD|uniref:Biopolymer transport protein ExbD n=2 Tax=Nonlabens dokdonensis TaxID=328515 RepID=A0ABX5Q1C5_9FLAO|nr:biopolymer transporter ExbD [Nonlabens dokdonensis]AGC76139.1 putative membrane protein [Nonlabens dokdonensis DSW-6]PZX43809.1 biopolymer transport protein ExbD [Nonlabens dokdonensis]